MNIQKDDKSKWLRLAQLRKAPTEGLVPLAKQTSLLYRVGLKATPLLHTKTTGPEEQVFLLLGEKSVYFEACAESVHWNQSHM